MTSPLAILSDFEGYKFEKNGIEEREGSRFRPSYGVLEDMCTANPGYHPFHKDADAFRKLVHRNAKAYVRVMLRFERPIRGLVSGKRFVAHRRRGRRTLRADGLARSEKIVDLHLNFIPFGAAADKLATKIINAMAEEPRRMQRRIRCQAVAGLFLSDDRNPTRDTMLQRVATLGALRRDRAGYSLDVRSLGADCGADLVSAGMLHMNRDWPNYALTFERGKMVFDNRMYFGLRHEPDYWDEVAMETLSMARDAGPT